MASLDTTSFASFLKELYNDKKLDELIYPNRPLLSMIPKTEKFVGSDYVLPANYAHNQAISASFTQAKAAAALTTGKYTRFTVPRIKMYAVCNVENEVINASADKIGAVVDAKTAEIDGQMEALANRVEAALFDSGWGDIGVVGTSGVSGATITLATTSSIHRVEVGQVHVFAGTQSTTVLAGSAGSLTVVGVNRNSGVITYNANVSTVSGVTDGYYIFNKGDREDSATPTRLLYSGLEAWAPYGGASSTLFMGVNRTIDSRLSGLYLNGASMALDDAIISAVNLMGAHGQAPTHAFCSFGQFAQLLKDNRSEQRFMQSDKEIGVGFTGVNVLTSKGPVKVIPSHNCLGTRCYVVDIKKLELCTLLKAVRIINDDGNTILRASDGDYNECRMSSVGNLLVRAPNAICTIQLTATGN